MNYIIYLGLNDKDSHNQEISTLDAYKLASNYLVNIVGGATIRETKGIYKHDDGTIVVENTLEILIAMIEESKLDEICDNLKILFNQESVMIEEVTSRINFR